VQRRPHLVPPSHATHPTPYCRDDDLFNFVASLCSERNDPQAMMTNKFHEYAANQIAERNSRAVCVQRRGFDPHSIGPARNRTNDWRQRFAVPAAVYRTMPEAPVGFMIPAPGRRNAP